MNHTPGPWTTDRKGMHGVANYTIIGTPINWHAEIARVYHGDRFADFDANVRLIAAAPELLDALKAMVSYIQTGAHEGGELKTCLADAVAAIAKAEGQT